MRDFSRRRFLSLTASTAGAFALRPLSAADTAPAAGSREAASFFLVGDTHYLANKEIPGELDGTSRGYTKRLIEWLNKLPGTELSAEAGGGKLGAPHGLIHAGDLIDSGDKNVVPYLEMQRTELGAWLSDYGLNGGDGGLPWPVREVHGNHDAPKGTGLVIDRIRQRNGGRKGIAAVSQNGVHYSWDWAGVHFINLGILVGTQNGEERPRRFAPLESLAFLEDDLKTRVGNSGRPVVITHHVDVARYCAPQDAPTAAKTEWMYADCRAYYETLSGYRIAAILYGHTHTRRVFGWNGSPPVKDGTPGGIPVFNTDNAAHFSFDEQAFFHFEVTDKEVVAREFATKDGWETAKWTPQVWRFAVA